MERVELPIQVAVEVAAEAIQEQEAPALLS